MDFLNQKINQFCDKHPRFGIPRLMLVVVIGTAIVYMLYVLTGFNVSAISFLGFDLRHLLRGEVWRIITFIFIPTTGMGGGITDAFWLIISLFFFYFIGTALEREWGTPKFNIYFFGGVVLSLLGTVILSICTLNFSIPLTGVYYVNLSMFFAFAMMFPDTTVLFMMILPIKIKYLGWLSAALFLYDMIAAIGSGAAVYVIFPVMALLNFFIFFGADLFRSIGRALGITKRRASPKTIRYRKAVKEQKRGKGYHHKCTICGKTDAQYPDMDFRYCSRCAGYHCYCAAHINDHSHIIEE